jgi:hypothetical protein
MAEILETSVGVHVRLSRWEQLGSLHGDLQIPAAHIDSREHVSDLWSHLRGMRAPGTGMPGVIMLGTTRFKIDGQWRKDFCAVYGHRAGTILTLTNYEFQRVLISDPK